MNEQTSRPVVLINVFTVQAERQMELLQQLLAFSKQKVVKMPGFISATFHTSLDGTRVTNIAHWQSKEAFLTFLQSPEGQNDMEKCRKIAQSLDYHLYTVANSFVSAISVRE